jgi:dynein heavy chain
VVLIREICNAIIRQCRNHITGEEIFGYIQGGEPQAAHNKLTVALDVCSRFKEAYFEYKAKAKNQWKITPCSSDSTPSQSAARTSCT